MNDLISFLETQKNLRINVNDRAAKILDYKLNFAFTLQRSWKYLVEYEDDQTQEWVEVFGYKIGEDHIF